MPKIKVGEPWEQNLRKKVRSISKLRKLKGFTVSQTKGKAILKFKNPGEKRTIGRMLKGSWTEDNAENLLAEISDFIGSEECYLWANEKRMDFPTPFKMKLTKSEALTVLELVRHASYLPAHIYRGEFKDNLDTIHDKLIDDIKQSKIL